MRGGIWLTILLTLTFYVANNSLLFAKEVQEEEQEEPFVYDDKNKRDPMMSLIGIGGGIITFEEDLLITDLHLEGIMTISEGKNVAIINGRIVKVNDSIGPYLIIKVSEISVTIMKEQEEFKLILKKEE